MLDLVIVGGGPAGLLAASRCAEAGLDVAVLEEHARVGAPTHCTGIVSLETTALAKIPDELVLKRLSRARLRGPQGAAVDVVWDMPDGDEILAIDRSGFDRYLAEQAVTAGVRLETRARVEHIAIEPRAVEVTVGDRTLRARACVLACGVSYRFQRQLGLGLPRLVTHTAQVEVASERADLVEIWVGRETAPGGFAWVVPVTRPDGDRLKVGIMAAGDAGAHLERFLATHVLKPCLLGDSGPPLRRLLPLQPIRRTYAERLLVVGDAGGFTKPTTGGGIFYSLLTASLAAETLVEGFQAGRLDAAFLGRFEGRWRAAIEQEIRVGGWLRRVVSKASDGEISLLVEALAQDDSQALIRRAARFNWHRDLIVALVRQPRLAGVLVRLLFR